MKQTPEHAKTGHNMKEIPKELLDKVRSSIPEVEHCRELKSRPRADSGRLLFRMSRIF
jgi:hypothetical protein